MSTTSITLLAARYPNQEHAKTILDTLEEMHRALTIDLKDAVMITKEPDGKIKTHETTDVTARKGALRGVIAGGIFGLIFPPSLLISAVAAGGIGALWGKIRDTGVKHEDIKEFAGDLAPGQAALVILVSSQTAEIAQETLGSYEGDVLTKIYREEDFVKEYEEEANS
ncbi:MAG TPA: DUF1269 domain-containing protein [Thermomicrobiales bacterium]|nr:DUF1269 domain-containing protein [Thermomicrobiales bacterium]